PYPSAGKVERVRKLTRRSARKSEGLRITGGGRDCDENRVRASLCAVGSIGAAPEVLYRDARARLLLGRTGALRGARARRRPAGHEPPRRGGSGAGAVRASERASRPSGGACPRASPLGPPAPSEALRRGGSGLSFSEPTPASPAPSPGAAHPPLPALAAAAR